MSNGSSTDHDEARSAPREELRVELDAAERRILGTLIEKNLTTPDYYPMTSKALVAGANQKNNRDPVSTLAEDEVQRTLATLQTKRLVMAVKPEHGHATRWRHELDRRFGVRGRELAVLGELLLRGPQTEGELRARASRMRAFPDIESLHEALAVLQAWTAPLVVRLSAAGAVRGVRHAHALYPSAELERIAAGEGSSDPGNIVASLGPSATQALEERIDALERRIARMETYISTEFGQVLPQE